MSSCLLSFYGLNPFAGGQKVRVFLPDNLEIEDVIKFGDEMCQSKLCRSFAGFEFSGEACEL